MRVTPWGTRRGGLNFGRGLLGSGAQSLRASETSTKPVRRVSEGCPVLLVMCEDLVAEGGDEEEIDFGHDASHLEGDHAAEAIDLDEVDGGEEVGLAEGVGPGVGDLGFELVDLMVENDLLEGGGAFGEEDEVEVVVGPVGEGDFDGRHA